MLLISHHNSSGQDRGKIGIGVPRASDQGVGYHRDVAADPTRATLRNEVALPPVPAGPAGDCSPVVHSLLFPDVHLILPNPVFIGYWEEDRGKIGGGRSEEQLATLFKPCFLHRNQ